MKALVIYNSYSPSAVESCTSIADEDTVKSAQLVAKILDGLGYETKLTEVEPEQAAGFDPGNADLVFNMCEWLGRDYVLEVELVSALEKSGVAYTGIDTKGHLWGSEKKVMKRLMKRAGLPIPETYIYGGGELVWPESIGFPAIIKPSLEHCSLGIEPGAVVENPKDGVKRIKSTFEKFKQPILVEEFLPGNEYQVFAFGIGDKIKVLPPYETVYRKTKEAPLLYFEENWVKEDVSDKVKRIGTVRSKTKAAELKKIAARAFAAMKCNGYVRLDLREKNHTPYILEINVNPRIGWDDECDLRVAAEAAGLTLPGVIKLITAGAFARQQEAHVSFA